MRMPLSNPVMSSASSWCRRRYWYYQIAFASKLELCQEWCNCAGWIVEDWPNQLLMGLVCASKNQLSDERKGAVFVASVGGIWSCPTMVQGWGCLYRTSRYALCWWQLWSVWGCNGGLGREDHPVVRQGEGMPIRLVPIPSLWFGGCRHRHQWGGGWGVPGSLPWWLVSVLCGTLFYITVTFLASHPKCNILTQKWGSVLTTPPLFLSPLE